jgi:hypothetical protein
VTAIPYPPKRLGEIGDRPPQFATSAPGRAYPDVAMALGLPCGLGSARCRAAPAIERSKGGAGRRGRVFTKEELFRDVWGLRSMGSNWRWYFMLKEEEGAL